MSVGQAGLGDVLGILCVGLWGDRGAGGVRESESESEGAAQAAVR